MLRRASAVPLLAAALLVLASCGEDAPPTETMLEGTFTVPPDALPAGGATDALGYLLWLPAGYDDPARGPWPLLVSLHGAGDVDNDAAWVGSTGLPAALHAGEVPDPFPYVVLVPRSVAGSPWSDQTEALAALVTSVGNDFRIDPAAVVVTGVDTGAEGALVLAARHPDLVRAVLGVATTVTRPLADAGLCGLEGVAVRLVHGRDDLVSPLATVRAEVGALEERCGFDVDLAVVPGGHFGVMSAAYRDPAALAWVGDVLAP